MLLEADKLYNSRKMDILKKMIKENNYVANIGPTPAFKSRLTNMLCDMEQILENRQNECMIAFMPGDVIYAGINKNELVISNTMMLSVNERFKYIAKMFSKANVFKGVNNVFNSYGLDVLVYTLNGKRSIYLLDTINFNICFLSKISDAILKLNNLDDIIFKAMIDVFKLQVNDEDDNKID